MIKLDDEWNIKKIEQVYCLRHTECEQGDDEDLGCACSYECRTCDVEPPKIISDKYRFIIKSINK